MVFLIPNGVEATKAENVTCASKIHSSQAQNKLYTHITNIDINWHFSLPPLLSVLPVQIWYSLAYNFPVLYYTLLYFLWKRTLNFHRNAFQVVIHNNSDPDSVFPSIFIHNPKYFWLRWNWKFTSRQIFIHPHFHILKFTFSRFSTTQNTGLYRHVTKCCPRPKRILEISR